ncbi:MAG TPA: UDP-N-acetylmuramoyl-L-alanyl-D-glutamate--2,6-diaminopimelate ligase [Clostridiales bacterium]|nr:UDP-N-acetylmuramoyl-L-alanyl-D-glutamate--2,6-diaminopimelate ligase [Clostridiales bacterium]
MEWHELTALAGFEAVGENREIADLQYDSRKAGKGSVFFCIRGENSDGHRFAAQAVASGASALVCEEMISGLDVPQLVVTDSREALAKMAEAFYGFPHKKLKIIGVTGTNGKTTATHLIKHILDDYGKQTALMGTNHIIIGDRVIPATHTTPESLEISGYLKEMTDAGCEYLVMEVSSHALKQGRVSALDFSIAAFTNLTQDHLDYHKTFDDYLQAKQLLFAGLRQESQGCGIVNYDSPYCADFLSVTKVPVKTYGLKDGADFQGKNIVMDANGTSFDLLFDGGSYLVKMNLIGDFNVYNALTAIAVSAAAGIPLAFISQSLACAKQVTGRFEKIKEKFGPTVIIDYAHTPDGLQNILETANKLRAKRVILVFGCGGDRDRTKRPVMGKIGGSLSDFALITSDNPRTEEPMSIIRMVEEGVKESGGAYEIRCDRREAIHDAVLMADDDDLVVIAGKGHEDYQIIGTEKHHFDDFEEVKKALALC